LKHKHKVFFLVSINQLPIKTAEQGIIKTNKIKLLKY